MTTMTRFSDVETQYTIFDEWEQGELCFMTTSLGDFMYDASTSDDLEWLDDSLTYTTREQFLENGWREFDSNT